MVLPPPPPIGALPPPPPAGTPKPASRPARRRSDPALDFLSLQFDPAKALAIRGVLFSPMRIYEKSNVGKLNKKIKERQCCADLERPNMKVAALENVQQCRFILPEEMEESWVHKKITPIKSRVSRLPVFIESTSYLCAHWSNIPACLKLNP